jgi:adsorption protein B
MVRLRILVLGTGPEGALQVATGGPLAPAAVQEIKAHWEGPVVVSVLRQSEVAAGLHLLATGSLPPPDAPKRLLGDVLLEAGALRRPELDAALGLYEPDHDGRFGEFLVRSGTITQAQLDAALAEAGTTPPSPTSSPAPTPAPVPVLAPAPAPAATD